MRKYTFTCCLILLSLVETHTFATSQLGNVRGVRTRSWRCSLTPPTKSSESVENGVNVEIATCNDQASRLIDREGKLQTSRLIDQEQKLFGVPIATAKPLALLLLSQFVLFIGVGAG